jgi:hypothetical protein
MAVTFAKAGGTLPYCEETFNRSRCEKDVATIDDQENGAQERTRIFPP